MPAKDMATYMREYRKFRSEQFNRLREWNDKLCNMDVNNADYWNKVSIGRIKARYISPFSIILHQNGIYPEIGEGTWVGHFTVIDGSQGLKIGKNCSIASGVHIYTHSTHLRTTQGKAKLTASVEIGDNVAIGANSVIMYGCKMGNNVVVAALTLLKPYTELKQNESSH